MSERRHPFVAHEPVMIPWQMRVMCDERRQAKLRDFFHREWPALATSPSVELRFVSFEAGAFEIEDNANVDIVMVELEDTIPCQGLLWLSQTRMSRANLRLLVLGMARGQNPDLYREALHRGCQWWFPVTAQGMALLKRLLRSFVEPSWQYAKEVPAWNHATILKEADITLDPKSQALFCRLFHDRKHVERVKELKSYQEEPHVLLKPRKFLVREETGQLHFVKVGSSDGLTQEYYRYMHHVAGRIENFAGRATDEPICIGHYGILRMSSVASEVDSENAPGGAERSLDRFLEEALVTEAQDVLTDLFTILERLAGQVREKPLSRDVIWKLWELLPPLLTVRFEAMLPRDATPVNDNDTSLALPNFVDPSDVESFGRFLHEIRLLPGSTLSIKDVQIVEVKRGEADNQTTLHVRDAGPLHIVVKIPAALARSVKMRGGKFVSFQGTVEETLFHFLRTKIHDAFGEQATWLDEVAFQEDGIHLPNPLSHIASVLGGTWQTDIGPVQARLSVVHGDLNLKNVLIASQPKSYRIWLIDFEKTQDDFFRVFDLAKLEVEIKNQILFPNLQTSLSHVLEVESLIDQVDKESLPQLPDDNKFLHILHFIRRHAIKCAGDPLVYYLCYMVYSLSTLKFDLPPEVKQRAFISSAWACQRLFDLQEERIQESDAIGE